MTQSTRLLLCLGMLLLPLYGLLAQTATLQGAITDAATGEALIGATIQAGSKGTVSDYEGRYTFVLSPGNQTIEISYIGYATVRQKIILATGETRQLDVNLTEGAQLLQTATVTSGKFEKPLGEVTVSLEVLRPEVIENTNQPTLDAALQKVPGVTVLDGQANIRGGSGYSYGAGSRVLLLVDDVPILQADAGFPNWDDVPVENIEQVEVVKGAASALYGSSALNGIINVRTAYAKSEPITKVATFYNAYLSPGDDSLKWWDNTPYTAGLSLSHRRKLNKTDLVLGGYYLNESSFRKDTYRRFGRFNFNVRHRLTDKLSFGLAGNRNAGKSGSYLYWKSASEGYEGDTSNVSRRERLRYNIDPFLTYYDGSNGRHRVLGRFYRVENDNDANQSNFSSLYYAEYQYQKKITAAELVMTAGVVSSGTRVEAELYGDTTFTSRNIAGYLQVDKEFFNRLNLSAGFRYERNRLDNPGFVYTGGVVDPSIEKESKPVFRLGANYRVALATYVRASWGQGYRFPTVAEKYIFTSAGGFNVVPNPSLTSETAWTAEVGLRQGFAIGTFQGFTDIAVFRTYFNNMTEFNLVGFGFRSVNVGETQIDGFDISVATQGKAGSVPINIIAGYTYVDPHYLDFDINADRMTQAFRNAQSSTSETDILKYRYQHVFKADVEATFGKLHLGTESFFFSRMEAIDKAFNLFINDLADYRMANQGTIWYHNFRVAYDIGDHYKVSVLLGNAFNRIYSLRPALLEAPRSLSVRVSAKW